MYAYSAAVLRAGPSHMHPELVSHNVTHANTMLHSVTHGQEPAGPARRRRLRSTLERRSQPTDSHCSAKFTIAAVRHRDQIHMLVGSLQGEQVSFSPRERWPGSADCVLPAASVQARLVRSVPSAIRGSSVPPSRMYKHGLTHQAAPGQPASLQACKVYTLEC